MNFKNLFKLGTLTLIITLALSSLSFAQTVRYLNSTDGDDSNTGVNATNNPLGSGPKKTIEGSYAAFPNNATVYMTAGEYHYDQSTAVDANGVAGGNDDNAVQIAGAKNMTFIIQTYNSSSVVYLNGTVAGAFTVNCPGKTIKFQAADGTQSMSINNGPFFNTATNAITLTAGTLDVSGLASFNVGGSVLTMTRTDGSVVGSFTYSAAARTMLYNSAAAGSQVAGGELQTALSGASDLQINLTGGSLSIPQNLTMTTGGTLRNVGTGSATISGTVAITGGAGAPSTISLTNTGALTLSNTVTISSQNETWGTFILKNGAGNLVISGALNINHGGTTGSDLDAGGATFTAFGGGANMIQNNNTTGKLSLSGLITFNKYTTGGTDYYVYVLVSNAVAGTIEIGNAGGSVLYGTIENDIAGAKVNLVGNLTMKQNIGGLAGSISNNTGTSTIALGANTLTIGTNAAPGVAGIRNAGIISSSSTGMLSFAHTVAGQTVTGAGSLPNIQTSGTQNVTAAATTTVNGNITVNATAGTLAMGAVTTVTGNVVLNGGQNFNTLGGAGGVAIAGGVSITAGTLTMGGAATIAGNLTLSGGGFTTGGNVTLSGNYTQNAGAFTFGGAHILDCKQSFTRTTGGFTNAVGTLQFSSGGQGQVVAGGPNFRVFNLVITGVGTGITLTSGSIEIVNSCTVNANTSIQLGALNINMVGLGSTITNGGQIFSSGLGEVIFSGPDDGGGIGTMGSVHIIAGTGKYSNIEIRLTDPRDVVTCAANVISWTGRLAFTRGGIDNSAVGAQLNPIDAVASMVINMTQDGASGFPQGKPYLAAGVYSPFSTVANFDVLNVLYDLTYWGTVTTGATIAGSEYKTPYVRDLTVQSTGAAGNYVEFGAAYTMVGNLTIPAGSQLNLNGSVLTASKTGASHLVAGTLSTTAGADYFDLTGDGTVTGSSTAADAATIENVNVNTSSVSATYAFNNFHALGKTATGLGFTMTTGTANIGMYQAAGPIPSPIYNFVQTGGTVALTADARISTGSNVSTFNISGGTFDFGNNNLWFSNANTFTATGGTFAITGATTGGYLQFRTTGATFNSGTVAVPRVSIDPTGAGAITVTLGGNSVVSDIFNNNKSTSTLALGANTLTLSGAGTVNQWNTAGLYTGTGLFYITGPVTMNLGGNTAIPNLQVDNTTTGTFTLVDNDGAAGTVPDLTVGLGGATGLFTMTSGVINLQNVDVLLVGTTAGVGNAFVYVAGTIQATTPAASSTTVPLVDNSYGELTFAAGAAQSFNITGTVGLTIPNLTINAASPVTYTSGGVGGEQTFTVSKYFKMGANVVMGVAGDMVFGDGAWIEMVAGTMDFVPAFGANINYVYNTAGAFVTGKELTTDATKIQKFWNTPGAGNSVTLNAATTTNNELRLINGNLLTTATKTMTMGANSLVTRIDGTINVAGTANANLLGGPITLTYLNTIATTTLSGEFPSTMTVTTLNVETNIAVPTTLGAPAPLALHASRTVGDFFMETDRAAAPQNGTQFDLNGNTLTVSNVASANLSRGRLTSYATGVGATSAYVYGSLVVAGNLTMSASASITNVNVTAATSANTSATLSGSFGTEDYDGGGANHVVPATLPVMTVGNTTYASNATIAGFTGNLTVFGNTIINGAYANGTLTAAGNVTVATGGALAAATNLVFNGTSVATLTIPTGTTTIGAITFSKTAGTVPTPTITLAGGNLTATALTTFVNGIFSTGGNTFTLWVPPFGTLPFNQGFSRVGVTGTNVSHVVGKIAKAVFNTGVLGTSCEPRQEFPVGDGTSTKLVAITFNPAFGLPTTPNATLTVSYTDANPGGGVGLPIKDGVATGIDVSKYPNFYWTIASSPFSIGPSTPFDLELTATGFTNFDDINNVRIIRRHGLVGDITNQWLLQGANDSYDNSVNAGVPTIIQRQANAGLRLGGAVFTLGLKSNMKINPNAGLVKYITTYKKIWLVKADVKTYTISDLFTGNSGTLKYDVQSSNTAVTTVEGLGSSIRLTAQNIGDCVVTVTAKDSTADYYDSFVYSFDVNVGLTGVETTDQLPTEFALFQNYPNPFNPTTNIKFDLPKESNVTLKVYNILGEEVATLVNKVMPAGHQVVTFDASRLASGMYIYRIQAGNFVQVKKMLLMK